MKSENIKNLFRDKPFIQSLRESKSDANFRRLVFDKIDSLDRNTSKKCRECGIGEIEPKYMGTLCKACWQMV